MIFVAFVDVKPGQDEEIYKVLEDLKGDGTVTPLLIGRFFEEADILILFHSEDMEALDDYLITNVRSMSAAEELVVIPIYEFTLLPSFDSIIELESGYEDIGPGAGQGGYVSIQGELLLIIVRVDVAPGMDRVVHRAVYSLKDYGGGVIPLMTGHTFHSKEFDLVFFFLSRDLENAWEFGKLLRSIDGVWDTELNLVAHFEALVSLERFKELASGGRTLR